MFELFYLCKVKMDFRIAVKDMVDLHSNQIAIGNKLILCNYAEEKLNTNSRVLYNCSCHTNSSYVTNFSIRQ